MAAGQFADAAGNVGNAVSLTADYSTLRPSVTGVALQGLDSLGAAKAGTLTPGDKVQVQVSFDDAIVHTVASSAAVGAKAGFALVLDNNALRLADYVSGSGTRVLVFEYVVGLGDLDRLGGIAAQANALVLPVGVSLQNAGGNEAALSTPVMAAGTNTLAVDGVPPDVSVLRDDSLAVVNTGGQARLRLTFTENPGSSFGLADVTVTGGSITTPVRDAVDPLVFTAEFTPEADFRGEALVSIATGVFSDAAGNLNARARQLSVRVDTKEPLAPTGSLHPDSDTGWSEATRQDARTNLAKPLLKGTAEPDATVKVRIALADESVWEGSARSDSQGNWSLSVGLALTDGVYAPTLEVVTAANNKSTGSVRPFTVDLSAPSASAITGRLAGDSDSDTGWSFSDGVTANAQPVLTGAAEALALVEVTVAGRTHTTRPTCRASGRSAWPRPSRPRPCPTAAIRRWCG
jgi:hypothetical protein